ncbi:alpha/beta hydrolase [Bacillus hominis]|uniref:Alpha/beta hydrolase n=1 Tax=Bacillus hominis TaxID=2817478 RepID=A0ABT7R5S3_9BACI|nr:alpha/beta hydrolase [Bacillus hominis]MDM5193092.1 alpha/beta hydrolase [Bacillus hominis]MDM5432834.1 alpha/beta hydrolase [Bacillus hominis]MDM5438256.1 alpha/beta hydrolase [Bacillus hominis]
MKELVSMGSSMFLQLLFLYIFISGVLLELNPWYAVVVYVAIAIISLLLGIYSIAFSMKSSLNTIFLTLPGGIVITLFSILIIGFTVFAYFLPEGYIPPVIRL